jgi:alcohol dehydrogenase, propanol-preferring
MLAARMHGYKQPLVLEEVTKPEMKADQVLVRVEAAGMCRTDFQLVEGYFKESLDLPFPAIPGHEIAGSVAEIGGRVPATANLALGDQVVVVGGRQ